MFHDDHNHSLVAVLMVVLVSSGYLKDLHAYVYHCTTLPYDGSGLNLEFPHTGDS